MDNIIIGLYAALFLFLPWRICVFALALFMLTITNKIDVVWLFYSVNCTIYLAGIVSKVMRIPAFIVAIHQYIMAWDGFFWPTQETILYNTYPYVSFALNLLIIYTIANKAGKDGVLTTNSGFDSHRVSAV